MVENFLGHLLRSPREFAVGQEYADYMISHVRVYYWAARRDLTNLAHFVRSRYMAALREHGAGETFDGLLEYFQRKARDNETMELLHTLLNPIREILENGQITSEWPPSKYYWDGEGKVASAVCDHCCYTLVVIIKFGYAFNTLFCPKCQAPATELIMHDL